LIARLLSLCISEESLRSSTIDVDERANLLVYRGLAWNEFGFGNEAVKNRTSHQGFKVNVALKSYR